MNLLNNFEEEEQTVVLKTLGKNPIKYGKDYGIHIKSEKGKGTRVTINLPIIK